MVFIKDNGGGNGDKYTKSGEREAFIGDGSRHDITCVSRSAMVGVEDQWR